MLNFRPHHGLCMQFFVGKGYSKAFVNNMANTIKQFNQNPQQKIKLTVSIDIICKSCPYNMGECASGQKVQKLDKQCLELCGLKENVIISWQDYKSLINKLIIQKNLLRLVCSDCQWYAVCQNICNNHKGDIMQNDTLNNIFTRRSIRNYLKKMPSQQEIDLVLKAAAYAPSAKNEQPWHFIVVKNQNIINKIRNSFGQNPLFNAPILVFAFGAESATEPIKDPCLAMQNLFIAAHSIGLGTCWINSVVRLLNSPQGEEILKLLNPPKDYKCVSCCVLGYPDETPQLKPRTENLVNIIE